MSNPALTARLAALVAAAKQHEVANSTQLVAIGIHGRSTVAIQLGIDDAQSLLTMLNTVPVKPWPACDTCGKPAMWRWRPILVTEEQLVVPDDSRNKTMRCGHHAPDTSTWKIDGVPDSPEKL